LPFFFFSTSSSTHRQILSFSQLFSDCDSAAECGQRYPKHGELLGRLAGTVALAMQSQLKKLLIACLLGFSKFSKSKDPPSGLTEERAAIEK